MSEKGRRRTNAKTSVRTGQRKPKLIRISLAQITLYTADPQFEWLSNLHHLSNTIPTALPAALSLLELCHPLVVVRNPSPDVTAPKADKEDVRGVLPTYRLLSGYRTFQLLMEKEGSSKTQILAIALPLTQVPSDQAFNIFDAITAKLLLSPNNRDLAVIGGTLLEDDRLRNLLSSQLDVETNEALAAHLGMSMPTLYRTTQTIRDSIKAEKKKRAAFDTVDLDVFPDGTE